MDVEQLCRLVERQSFLEKCAQEGDFIDTIARISGAGMAGLGGYGLARLLGQERWTGLPDWLVGPTFGLGLGIPLYRGIKYLVGRNKQRELENEEQLAAYGALEEQAREMLAQAMLTGSVLPAAVPGVYQTASGVMPMTPGKMKRAGDGVGGGGIEDTSKTYGKGSSKTPKQAQESYYNYKTGYGKRSQLGMGENYGSAGAHGTTKSGRLPKKIKKIGQALVVPANMADAYLQEIINRNAQAAIQQQQAMAQQVALAQMIKGQYRGLQGLAQRQAIAQAAQAAQAAQTA